ncbi:MAG: hypothetical protein QNJ09_18240 [Paracoccaceae bacterium]|nr:hypothetical protein [Paracoccaceae bacterium]
MQVSKSHDIRKMDKRAQAMIHAAELHVRAQIAEALLSERKPGKPNPEEPNVADAALRFIGEIDKKKRNALIEALLTSDLSTRALTKKERKDLRDWSSPKDERPMVERTDLPRAWAEILLDGGKPPEEDDQRQLVPWARERISWFYPDILADPGPDGRDEDDVPGEPDDSDDEGGGGAPDEFQGTPPTPPARLRFWVDRVHCIHPTGELGRDEINYSGVATEGPLALFSQPSMIGSTRLGIRNAGQFNNDDSIDESVRGPMHSYDLRGQSFPRLYVVHLTMAEIDGGGFDEFMSDFNDALAAELETRWRFLVQMTVAFTAIYSLGGYLIFRSLLAAALGALSALLGSVIAVATTTNNDDIFEYGTIALRLENDAINRPPFSGSRESPSTPVRLELNAALNTAIYEIWYHWELVGGSSGQGSQDQDPPVDEDQDPV